jgi:hypothetical protein
LQDSPVRKQFFLGVKNEKSQCPYRIAESRRVVLGKRRPLYGGMRGPESLSKGQIVEPRFQRGKFERRIFFIYMN